jgi:hypothetical protein
MESLSNWFVGGGLITVIGFTVATYWKMGKVKEDADKQIGRVYQRLDETKDKLDINYTKKEVCEVVHKSVDKTLQEVKDKVDCIPKIKAGIDLLLQKNGINDGK